MTQEIAKNNVIAGGGGGEKITSGIGFCENLILCEEC